MASAFPDVAPTAEADWLRWAAARPRLQWDVEATGSKSIDIVVVSPHPDDETLACGALIADVCRRGHTVRVVAVTDGEGSHPDVIDLASVRRSEQSRALAILGCTAPPIRLSMPDGRVSTATVELESALLRIASDCDVLISPWSLDGHTDHDECGVAARVVAQTLDRPLFMYPVWAWQWATPRVLDAAAGWSVSAPSVCAVAAKRAAVECFPSQTTARYGTVIVDDVAIERFQRPFEVFTRAR